MTYAGVPWRHALPSDANSAYFLKHRGARFEPIDRFGVGCRRLMYKILEPNAKVCYFFNLLFPD